MNKLVKLGYTLLVSAALSLSFVSCSNEDSPLNEAENPKEETNDEEPNDFTRIKLTDTQKEVSHKGLDFAGRAFKAINQETKDENVVFSPLSCQLCLSMLANSCQGKAHDQIIDVLGFKDFSIDEINEYNTLLTSEIKRRDKTVTIESANGFFQAPSIAPYVTKSYKELLTESYDAEILSNENLINSINQWANEKTHGMIPSLYNDINEDFNMVALGLVNALYFKGPWTFPFDDEKTFKGKFNLTERNTIEVEYMSAKISGALYDYGMAKSIKKDFGNLSFYFEILLPNEDVDINECIDNLDISKREITGPCDIDFTLPKFSLNTNINLDEVLKDLGMLDIFEIGKTDFSPMLGDVDTSEIYFGDFKQGCGISIDEEGATASSATAGLGWVTSTGEKPIPVTFTVDRPFVFLIKEYCTNSILLMGKVENPKK